MELFLALAVVLMVLPLFVGFICLLVGSYERQLKKLYPNSLEIQVVGAILGAFFTSGLLIFALVCLYGAFR